MRNLYISILLLFFASCATTNYINIDVKEPAAVTFPVEVKNVMIVDNSASIKDDANDPTKIFILTTDSAKAVMLNSLRTFMNEEKYFDSVTLYPVTTNKTENVDEAKPLSPARVRSICRQGKTDALIALDLFVVSAQLESENTVYFNNYSFLSSHIGTILRIYNQDGSQLSRPVVYLDSLFLEGNADWGNRLNSISAINNLVTDISIKAADNLTSAFIPSWKSQDRWYFSDNSKEMKLASKYVNEGKWTEAAELWSTLYENEKNKTKKTKLASNLALANECLDDIDNALFWINIAYDMLPTKSRSEIALLTLHFKNALQKRSNERPKLYEQLGLTFMDDESDESESNESSE